MSNAMKLRKIGNSLGTTFSREVLQKAGFAPDDELEVTASAGEIRLRRTNGRLLVNLSRAEADALLACKMDSKDGLSALAKVRKLIKSE